MTISRILAATDFSIPAQRAMHRAAHLSRQSGAELRLIHVLPDAAPIERLFHRREITHAQMLKGAEQALQTACENLERTNGVKVTWAVVIGNARNAIVEAVETFSANLLVVGARGENESPFCEPSLGGTALKLVANSPAPLLLVRRPVEDHYRKLVIAVAEAETGRRMLAAAQPFAESAQCHLLHVFEAPFAARLRSFKISTAAIDAYAMEQRNAEQKTLELLIAESAYKDRLRPLVVRGDAVAGVLREIESLQPDLAVVGKHGKRARRKTASEAGSVALRLTFSAPCDVLQIP